MVCECGHNKNEHAYGRDYGSHGYTCEHKNEKDTNEYQKSGRHCNCEYYRKKEKVLEK